MLPEYQNFMSVVNMVDTIVTLIIPLTLIIVMNTMIAHNLILFSRRVQAGRILDDSSFDNSRGAQNSTELHIRTNSQVKIEKKKKEIENVPLERDGSVFITNRKR